jgi:hypothetical protein
MKPKHFSGEAPKFQNKPYWKALQSPLYQVLLPFTHPPTHPPNKSSSGVNQQFSTLHFYTSLNTGCIVLF